MVALFHTMIKTLIFPSRRLILLLGISLASACSPSPASTPFVPPTSQSQLVEPAFIIQPTQNAIVVQTTSIPTILPTTSLDTCVNSLVFIEDLTIPDNSFITYGSAIDKQWLVENNGTCNWSDAYRLKHVGGGELGAPEEIALYPARAATQAVIQITFTAPFTDGEYESAWQAFDPFGLAFGDPIYIRIVVAAP